MWLRYFTLKTVKSAWINHTFTGLKWCNLSSHNLIIMVDMMVFRFTIRWQKCQHIEDIIPSRWRHHDEVMSLACPLVNLLLMQKCQYKDNTNTSLYDVNPYGSVQYRRPILGLRTLYTRSLWITIILDNNIKFKSAANVLLAIKLPILRIQYCYGYIQKLNNLEISPPTSFDMFSKLN